MKRRNTIPAIAILGVGLFGFSSDTGATTREEAKLSASTESAPSSSLQLLIEEDLGEGGTLQVYNDEEAGLILFSTKTPLSDNRSFEGHQGMDRAVDIYEQITNRPAPELLRQLEEEHLATDTQDHQAEFTTSRSSSTPAKTTRAANQTDFEARYCGDVEGFYCGMRRTGDATIYSDGPQFAMFHVGEAYRGDIELSIDYKTLFGWKNADTITIEEGYRGSITATASIINRRFRGKIREADGDGYHHAVWR